MDRDAPEKKIGLNIHLKLCNFMKLLCLNYKHSQDFLLFAVLKKIILDQDECVSK